MQRQYELEFQPSKRRQRDQLARLLLGFGAILLLLVVASAYAMQKNGWIDQWLNPTTEAQTDPEGTWTYTGSAVFLLCETDSKAKDLRFAMLVRADAAKREIQIFPLAPTAKAPLEDKDITLEQALREGGVKNLKAAAEALTETKIDRWIAGDDSAFTRAVNTMGSVAVHMEERVNYRSPEFSLTLAQGSQRLPGDSLLRYFRYLGTLGEEGPHAQGELLKLLLETYLAPKNGGTLDFLEARFNAMESLLQTDISITDFIGAQDLLLALLAESDQIQIDVKE